MPRVKERVKERIPIILTKINWFDFIKYLGFDNPQKIADKCIIEMESIEKIWMENSDLRLTQVLVTGGILENIPGTWYYIEEVDYMIKNKVVKPEKLLFWGTYGKDRKQPLKMIAINDMDSEHIESCLRTQKHMSDEYKRVMKKVLRIRKLKSLTENKNNYGKDKIK
jgi:hypothetical protein